MAEATQTSPPGSGSPPPEKGSSGDNGWRKEYWRRNLRLMVVLLTIWFVVSFVCGILLIEPLNEIVIFGFPLGLWFAQQGSIYTFCHSHSGLRQAHGPAGRRVRRERA